MRVKKIFLVLGIMIAVIIGILLCLSVYLEQHLYLPATSDAQLLEQLFPADFPGYTNLEILSSEGEGVRRIPRTIEIMVQIESYPQPVSCRGEVFYAEGDPMALNVRWQNLQCAGQSRYMEMAQIALQSGFTYFECHSEKTLLLLARWVKLGLINMDAIMFPEVQERVSELVADPDMLTRQSALDSGLFDTSKIILRKDVVSEDSAGQRPSIVLRCDGRVELFEIDPGLIHSYTDIPPGDDLMPSTLEPFTLP